MQLGIRSTAGLVFTFAVIGCGSPAAPPSAPPAPAPAPTAAAPPAMPASPITDPKGTVDSAKAAAGAASVAMAARQTAAIGPTPQSPAAGPSEIQGAAAAAAPALTPTAPKYDAGGRRDPFESLELKVGSERSTVAAAKLTGVVRSGGEALALVETSDGIGYILKHGDVLADGRLVEITRNTAVFAIASKPGSTTNKIVLRLPSD